MSRFIKISTINVITVALLVSIAVKAQTVDKSAGVDPYEEVWTAFTDEPARRYKMSREKFMEKDMKAAANEILKAAAFLKLESSRANEEGKKSLDDSIKELEKTAEEVEKGNITDVEQLDNVFIRANTSLAKHHYLKALDASAENNFTEAAKELKAAVISLEGGASAIGRKMGKTSLAIMEKSRVLAEKLAKESRLVAEELGKALQEFGSEIEKFTKEILPKNN